MPIPMLAMSVKGYAGAAWKGYKGPFRAKKISAHSTVSIEFPRYGYLV